MADVRILVVETGGVDDQDQRESTPADTLLCAGIKNTTGDLLLTTSTQSKGINALVSDLATLDSNKDNSVAGFVRATMNNKSLYDAIQQITGGGTPGPAVYPLNFGRNISGSATIDYYSGVRSNITPAIVPFDAQSMFVSMANQNLCQFSFSIYRNTTFPIVTDGTTLVYTQSTTGVNARSISSSSINVAFTASDMLTVVVTQISGTLQNPGVSLWLRSN